MKEQYLLGSTNNNELVFGEFEITNRNGYNQFTASFITVRPFNGNMDFVEWYKEYLDSLDKADRYDLCEEFDCAPSELAENLATQVNDPRDIMDCSLYPEHVYINGNDWYFESGSCGQHDTREEMEIIINPDAYNLLHELWDKYHLCKVDENVMSQIEALREMLCDLNEEEWICDFIKSHESEL